MLGDGGARKIDQLGDVYCDTLFRDFVACVEVGVQEGKLHSIKYNRIVRKMNKPLLFANSLYVYHIFKHYLHSFRPACMVSGLKS